MILYRDSAWNRTHLCTDEALLSFIGPTCTGVEIYFTKLDFLPIDHPERTSWTVLTASHHLLTLSSVEFTRSDERVDLGCVDCVDPVLESR